MSYGLWPTLDGLKIKIRPLDPVSHPKAPILIDLFAGGCAVTDAALERGQRVVACDRCWQVLDLFDKVLYDARHRCQRCPKQTKN